MRLTAGHFNLFEIYAFVASHPKFVSGINGDMREYTKLATRLVDSVPAQAGWYLWGCFNDVGFWETRYLGKAGNKKTSSLKARIKEELLDERGAFWATVYGSEPVERQFQKIYKGRYAAGTRAYRKRNAHFIVWASAEPITEELVKKEESALIAAYRPAINIQRSVYSRRTARTDKTILMIDKEIKILTNS